MMRLATFPRAHTSSTKISKHTIVFWFDALSYGLCDIWVSATDDDGNRRHCGRVVSWMHSWKRRPWCSAEGDWSGYKTGKQSYGHQIEIFESMSQGCLHICCASCCNASALLCLNPTLVLNGTWRSARCGEHVVRSTSRLTVFQRPHIHSYRYALFLYYTNWKDSV